MRATTVMVSSSPPAPAVLVEKTHGAANEVRDVAPPFARRAAAMMNDANARQVHASRNAIEPHAPVEVFEIEEKGRIEAAGGLDRLAPQQHARAAHHWHRRHDLGA